MARIVTMNDESVTRRKLEKPADLHVCNGNHLLGKTCAMCTRIIDVRIVCGHNITCIYIYVCVYVYSDADYCITYENSQCGLKVCA